jgi:hypothetical protein
LIAPSESSLIQGLFGGQQLSKDAAVTRPNLFAVYAASFQRSFCALRARDIVASLIVSQAARIALGNIDHVSMTTILCWPFNSDGEVGLGK